MRDCVLKKVHTNLICFYLCCSQKYVMFLFYTFNTSRDQKKNPNPTYLCTCFNTWQYFVSWNTLQQTQGHKENSMTKKNQKKPPKQNIQNYNTMAFVLQKTKWLGFVAGIVFVWFFFPPEILELSFGLWFLILKKHLCSARLFITYQQTSHASVYKFPYNTWIVLLLTIT